MKKILIYPGAFNPPHLGHASTLLLALEKYSFDEIWVIPSGKRNDKVIPITYSQRKDLGNLFVNFLQTKTSIPIKLITAELDDKDSRLTQDILREIVSTPNTDITQLIGLDSMIKLQQFLDDSSKEKFLVVYRPGYDLSKLNKNENIKIIETQEQEDISSTLIRDLVKNKNLKFKKYLPQEIANYIEENKLFTE